MVSEAAAKATALARHSHTFRAIFEIDTVCGMMTYPGVQPISVRRHQLWDWLRRGLDLLFPPRCVACSRLGTWFCADCVVSVTPIPQPICPRCGLPTARQRLCFRCRKRPLELDAVRSVGVHSGALREAIHHLKFRGRKELAAPLGQMLFTYWQGENLSADLVVPVPLHPSREKERGFNQAGLLAGILAGQASLPLCETSLKRTRATAPQVGLGVEERKANVEEAFVWAGKGLDGARILLVDDVCTTGATLEACAAALRQAGAGAVRALTLARPLAVSD